MSERARRQKSGKKIATKFETKAQVEKIKIKIVLAAVPMNKKCFSIPPCTHRRLVSLLLCLWSYQQRPEAVFILYNKILQCALNSKIHHARKNRSVLQPLKIVSRPIKRNVKWLVLYAILGDVPFAYFA